MWAPAAQEDGVTFLYEAVMGVRDPRFNGAILADEMGLGEEQVGEASHRNWRAPVGASAIVRGRMTPASKSCRQR